MLFHALRRAQLVIIIRCTANSGTFRAEMQGCYMSDWQTLARVARFSAGGGHSRLGDR